MRRSVRMFVSIFAVLSLLLLAACQDDSPGGSSRPDSTGGSGESVHCPTPAPVGGATDPGGEPNDEKAEQKTANEAVRGDDSGTGGGATDPESGDAGQVAGGDAGQDGSGKPGQTSGNEPGDGVTSGTQFQPNDC